MEDTQQVVGYKLLREMFGNTLWMVNIGILLGCWDVGLLQVKKLEFNVFNC
jgi:hypothetical protein